MDNPSDLCDLMMQVADFVMPDHVVDGRLGSGAHVLKKDIWIAEFDPVHCQLRALQDEDYMRAVDRYRRV